MIGLFCNLSLCFACEQRYTSDGGTHHHIDDEIRKLEQHRESMSVCVCESSCKLLQHSKLYHMHVTKHAFSTAAAHCLCTRTPFLVPAAVFAVCVSTCECVYVVCVCVCGDWCSSVSETAAAHCICTCTPFVD